jgi:hypothetical protein
MAATVTGVGEDEDDRVDFWHGGSIPSARKVMAARRISRDARPGSGRLGMAGRSEGRRARIRRSVPEKKDGARESE